MNSNDFVSENFILSEVAQYTGDTSFSNGISIGFYRGRIQEAVEALAIHTFFDVKTIDVFNWKKYFSEHGNCNMPMPHNTFNIREVYMFNGKCSCNSECNNKCGKTLATDMTEVHWKRLHNRFGASHLQSSKINSSSAIDSVNQRGILRGASNLIYASMQNGVISFSLNADRYEHVRIVANGLGGGIGEELIIPRMFRQAIVDFAVERVLFAWKNRDRTKRLDWVDAKNNLESTSITKTSNWLMAKRLAKSMSTFEKESMKNYMSSYEF